MNQIPVPAEGIKNNSTNFLSFKGSCYLISPTHPLSLFKSKDTWSRGPGGLPKMTHLCNQERQNLIAITLILCSLQDTIWV